MEEPKDKILISAVQVFMKIGVKSVTMDDISRELGISKKTLYQFVEDKNDLLKQCFALSLNKNCIEIQQLNSIDNPIDEVLEIMKHMIVAMKKINPIAMYEIRKYYPESWNLFESFKNEYIFNSVKNNFEKGIKKGIYRKKIDVEVIAKIYVEVISLLISEQIFPSYEFAFPRVHSQFIEYHLRGICTNKGLEYLEIKLKELSL